MKQNLFVSMTIAVFCCLVFASNPTAAFGCNQTAPSTASTGFVDITKEPYCVNTPGNTGSAFVTAKIQQAINDLAGTSSVPTNNGTNGGGILYFPNGVYQVDGNIKLKSGVTIKGTNSHTNENYDVGSKIKLVNPSDASIFVIEEGIRRMVIENIHLTTDRMTIAARGNTKAIYAHNPSSTTNNPSFDLLIRSVTFKNFGIAVHVEAKDSQKAWQFELAKMDHCSVYDSNKAVLLDSVNTEWQFSNCWFGVDTNGVAVEILRGGFLSFEHVIGAGPPGSYNIPPNPPTNPKANTFIWIRGSHGTININNSECEGFHHSIQIDASTYLGAITLVNNIFGDKIELRANTNFVSVGNQYWSDTVEVITPYMTSRLDNGAPGADHAVIYSKGDYFHGVTHDLKNCGDAPSFPTADPSQCKRDFYLNNLPAIGAYTTYGYNNRLAGRDGLTTADFNNPVRIARNPIQTPPNVLLNLSAQRSGEIPLRIGGSAAQANGTESCPDCYYEIKRDDTSTDGTIGFLSFKGNQSGYQGYKFNGSLVPSTSGGGSLGSPTQKWQKIYAIDHVMGDAILTDRETGKELYRIREDENFIYFSDIRTGKLMMKLDRNGNMYLAGKVYQNSAMQTQKSRQKPSSTSRKSPLKLKK